MKSWISDPLGGFTPSSQSSTVHLLSVKHFMHVSKPTYSYTYPWHLSFRSLIHGHIHNSNVLPPSFHSSLRTASTVPESFVARRQIHRSQNLVHFLPHSAKDRQNRQDLDNLLFGKDTGDKGYP
ncbi:hypothetical protein ACMFMG_005364 [Clarireedia jacksonii]